MAEEKGYNGPESLCSVMAYFIKIPLVKASLKAKPDANERNTASHVTMGVVCVCVYVCVYLFNMKGSKVFETILQSTTMESPLHIYYLL